MSIGMTINLGKLRDVGEIRLVLVFMVCFLRLEDDFIPMPIFLRSEVIFRTWCKNWYFQELVLRQSRVTNTFDFHFSYPTYLAFCPRKRVEACDIRHRIQQTLHQHNYLCSFHWIRKMFKNIANNGHYTITWHSDSNFEIKPSLYFRHYLTRCLILEDM